MCSIFVYAGPWTLHFCLVLIQSISGSEYFTTEGKRHQLSELWAGASKFGVTSSKSPALRDSSRDGGAAQLSVSCVAAHTASVSGGGVLTWAPNSIAMKSSGQGVIVLCDVGKTALKNTAQIYLLFVSERCKKKSHPALSLSCQNVNDQNKTVVLGAIVHPWRPANIFVTVFVHARWEEGDERRGYYFTSSL